ncbi:MAG TPA: hypothetical protein VJI75_01005 [Candidatus Nanoarchaeia archaeon]|nr:hypothetical protein [Candidatus Nanoarchaeia archaeon]
MATKITFNGKTMGYGNNEPTFFENKEVGYCIEEPLDVLKRLGCNYKIRIYQDIINPFYDYDNGLHIISSKGPRGTTIIGTLNELVGDLLDTMIVSFNNGYPCRPKLKKSLDLDKLKELFLKRIFDPKEHCFSIDGSGINKERYWMKVDYYFLHRIADALDDDSDLGISVSHKILTSYEDFLIPTNSTRKEGMNTLLPRIRKEVPQLTQEIEATALTELHKILFLTTHLEMLSLFGIEDATCYDLKRMALELDKNIIS